MFDKRYVICLVLLAVVVLLNLPASTSMWIRLSSRDNLAPFQNVMSMLIQKASAGLGFVAHAGRTLDEKKALREEVARLRHEVERQAGLGRENEFLRKQLAFRVSYRYRLVFCRVVARGDTTGWWQTLRLDRGSTDGIRPNMAVITPDGLVGKTSAVSRRTSEVLLITDPNCRVACRVARTGALGILQGAGVRLDGDADLEMLSAVRPSRMDFLGTEREIRYRDRVVTSGLGGVYPADLAVGSVTRASVHRSGLYQQAEVAPAADLGQLRHVFVVDMAESAAGARGGTGDAAAGTETGP